MSTPQDPDRPSSGSHPLAEHLAEAAKQDGVEGAHAAEALRRVKTFLSRPHPEAQMPNRLNAPPGSPIGQKPPE